MWNRRALAALVALSVAGCGAVRAADVCDGTRLALDASQGRLHARFAVEHAEGSPWELVVVHEGHIAWRGQASPDARGHLSLDRRMKDYEGADHVSVRATGPRGRICTAERTLAQAN